MKQVKFRGKYTTSEVEKCIYQLRDLVADRKSFLNGDKEYDDVFLEDIRYLEMAINIIENRSVNEMTCEQFPQDSQPNEYRYISPYWLDNIAKGLTKGAEKHPGETWRQIPANEHLARAMRHINLFLMGDKSEPHIINASMRLMMAFETVAEVIE